MTQSKGAIGEGGKDVEVWAKLLPRRDEFVDHRGRDGASNEKARSEKRAADPWDEASQILVALLPAGGGGTSVAASESTAWFDAARLILMHLGARLGGREEEANGLDPMHHHTPRELVHDMQV